MKDSSKEAKKEQAIGTQVIRLRLKGVTPLLMHDDKGVNPLHPLSKAMKELTSKRKKTDDDFQAISDLEFQLGLYFDKEAGPFLPAEMLDAALRDGAKKFKLGTLVTAAVTAYPDRIPVEYDGPRTVEELMADISFRDVRRVTVNGKGGGSVLRTRPRFERWSIEFELHFDPTMIDRSQVLQSLNAAAQYGSLGDFRPRYGKFVIIPLDDEDKKAA